MLNYVTVEHVHSCVIGELKLKLYGFPRIKVPSLLHGLVGVTRYAFSTDALLGDIVNVYGMRLVGRIRKDPLLGRPKHRTGIDSVRIEPLSIDCPVTGCLVKAPVARHGGLSDIWQ